ncbi:hypothetical protein LOTGIDRAFT_124784, partial [Lottia gigantea]
ECLLSVDFGDCPESTLVSTRYYYNKDKDQCEAFSFNGCGGNANNFDTLAECESMC